MTEGKYLSDDSDDYAILNGCYVGLPYNSTKPTDVVYTDKNDIRITTHNHEIMIINIRFEDRETLKIMLEALSRYASLINASRIVSSPDLPMEIMEILDQNGVLDRWYGQPQEK